MKTVIYSMITLAGLSLFAACGNSQQAAATDSLAEQQHAVKEEHKHSNHEEQQHASTATQQHAMENAHVPVRIKDDKLNAVYQHYIHLTTALLGGDIAEAKIAATAIELGAKELSKGNTMTVLTAKIAAATDLETQRKIFAELSNDIISRVKRTGMQSGEVYVEYCPMALNNKGASWLSSSKDIKNPYYGDSMLSCGEVTETIK